MTPNEINFSKPNDTLWDDTVKGLHLRCFASGKRVFYLFYRTASGIQRRPKLGEYPTLSLSDARSLAKSWLLQVANGGDPSRNRSEARSEMTVAELFGLTWKGHWDAPRFHESGHAKEVYHLWSGNIAPELAYLKLSEVTAVRVRNWHAALGKAPYAANRSLSVLSRMFNFAEEQELRPQGSNPCRLVKHFKEKKRERFATPEELERLGGVLEKYRDTHPHSVLYLEFMLFTGCRPQDIEKSELTYFEQVQLEGQTFGILHLKGKTGQEKIYVPPTLVQKIKQIDHLAPLFGSKFPRKFWNKVRKEAGCPDLWARDSRRTFATTALSNGNDATVIGELLNHKSAQTTKIYAKLIDTARLALVAETASKIEKLLGGKKSA